MRTVSTSGVVTGTAAQIDIELGYVPTWVRVINTTDGEEIYVTREMLDLGTPVYGIKRLATGVSSALASAGVGVSDYVGVVEDGSGNGASVGFSIGATATLNVAAEAIVWEAGFDDE